MQDLLRQEAQREADVQELDEQVPCLFRVLVPVVTVTAWQMDRERINASLQDIGSGNGSFEAARGNPCSDSESFVQRVAHPYDELGDVHSAGRLIDGVVCDACGARKWPGEGMSCCGTHRSIVLPDSHTIPAPPELLSRFMDPNYAHYDADLGRVWRGHSRGINSCLAFASSQVREAHLPGGRGAPPYFAINGAVCPALAA